MTEKPTTDAQRRTFAKAILAHTVQSRTDRTPAQALRSLMNVLFNLLGCADAARFTTIDPAFFTDFKSPQRLNDIPTLKAMTRAYLDYVAVLPPFEDAITTLATEFQGTDGEGLGQFFTPRDLALLSADLAFDHLQRHPSARHRISDPTGCGTGSLLLAQLSVLHANAPDLLPVTDIHGLDLDADMVRATAVQIAWNVFVHRIDIGSLTLHCGNALTDGMTTPPVFVFTPLHPKGF